MTQETRSADALLQGIQATEDMVNTLAESTKQYWRLWGPLGEPMIYSIDTWARMQRSYFQLLREASGIGSPSFPMSPYAEDGDELIKNRTSEAREIARQSAKEAQKIADEAKKRSKEIEKGS
jgi:hypothetical protein